MIVESSARESAERVRAPRCAARAGLVAVALIAGVAPATGCGRTAFGTLGPSGFRSATYGYQIHAQPDGSFISADWMVDNYYLAGGEWAPRTGPDFETRLWLDTNGDGLTDDAGTVPTYDLLLRNRRDAGTIWVRVFPLSTRFDQTELRVLARKYVDSVSGTGTVVTGISQGEGQVEVVEESNRFATRTLEEAPMAVDGFEAYRVTFEVANVDQLSLAESSRWERAVVVFVRAGFLWRPDSSRDSALFPATVMLGYSNLPEDFEAHLADFESLIAALDWLDEELQEVRRTVLDCTAAELVRLLVSKSLGYGGRSGRSAIIRSPDVTPAELDCLTTAVPALTLSFAARRFPYVAPEAAPPTPLPDSPAVEPETSDPPVVEPVFLPQAADAAPESPTVAGP
ncbi:MAG: hypothetical protein HY905_15340 [Deltaproteobacteria bacterium]|nr:hypothetical protein [Deltaproteobacteria bacterium]